MMRIYYTATDCGDGSLNVEFFESQECIDLLEKADPESYRGEGGCFFETDATIITVHVRTISDVRQQLAEIAEDEDFDDDET